MEDLIITESKTAYSDILAAPSSLYITHAQALLLLPCLNKKVFSTITVHNNEFFKACPSFTLLGVLKDNGLLRIRNSKLKH